MSCCGKETDKNSQSYLEHRVDQNKFPKCFSQFRKFGCIRCSPVSYLFTKSINSDLNVVICQDFCVDFFTKCKEENATFSDPDKSGQYVNIFPYEQSSEVVCGIVNSTQANNMNSLSGFSSTISKYLSTFSLLSNWMNTVSNNDYYTITIDNLPVVVSLNCKADLQKLQHCYPGTSTVVNEGFITSIIVYVWVVGIIVSSLTAVTIYFCKWKRRGYQQIL